MALLVDTAISISSKLLGLEVQVKFPAYALIVEISLSAKISTPPGKKFFAVVDTGNFADLAIVTDLLKIWGGQTSSQFAKSKSIPVTFGNAVPSGDTQLYDTDIWLYPNQPGIQPILMPGTGAFVIYPQQTNASGKPSSYRPPLIGQRALHAAGLNLEIDYKNLSFKLSRV